jgi:CoA:oxalate CoA-transferase
VERLGFAYEDVAKMNPRIVYASLSGFGQYGPYKDKGAYDVVIQGYGGTISITGSPGGEPVRVGFSIGDLAASLYTAIGILGALHVRDQTGRGQYIDIAMLDCQVALLENALIRHTVTGEIPQPLGTRHPALAPFQVFKANDGYFTVCAPHDRQFNALCQILNISKLPKRNGLPAIECV